MNGDVLTNLNYLEFYQFHKEQRSMVTIATYERTVKVDFGIIETGENNRITEYVEKPTLNYKVSMGIYVFSPKVMKYIKADSYFDFPDLVKLLIHEGEKVTAYSFNGYWLDIGRPDDYEKAIAEFQQNKNKFLP
jgi:NDP-sugar pyrophosphorylase family protein